MDKTDTVDNAALPIVVLGLSQGTIAVAYTGATPPTVGLDADGEYVGAFAVVPDKHNNVSLLVGVNQLSDPDFEAARLGWRLGETGDTVTAGVGFSEKWNLTDGNAAYIRLSDPTAQDAAELSYGATPEAGRIPVTPGVAYAARVAFGCHRCVASLVLVFRDAGGAVISTYKASPAEVKSGGRRLSNYAGAKIVAKAPAGAVSASLSILVEAVKAEDRNDSLLLIARPWFGEDGKAARALQALVAQSPDSVAQLRLLGGASSTLGFVQIPSGLFDGRLHTLTVGPGSAEQTVVGTPLEFQFADAAEGAIDRIQGSEVLGWASSGQGDAVALRVRLVIDGVPATSTLANGGHARMGQTGFVLPIPAQHLDGLPHHVKIVSDVSGKVIAEAVELFAASSTPHEALLEYQTKPPAYLSPASRYRYLSYIEAVRSVIGDDGKLARDAGDRLAQLDLVHGILLEGPFATRSTYPKLSFPTAANPTVSIVVPAHNKFSVTYYCLAALLFAGNKTTFEVIVVDDGSSDQTASIEQIVSGIRVVRHERATGFVDACNDGAAAATGDYVLLLNNDTEVTAGWLDELVATFANFDNVGAVGAKLLYANGRLQEAGGIVWGTGDPWNYGRDQNAADPRYNYVRQSDYLSGACLILPTSLWRELGGLSEEYRPAYFEDTDLCFKVKAAGKKLIYNPFAVVYHFEGVSNGTQTTSGLKRFQEINRPKFKRKWAELYRANGPVGRDVELAKDRGVTLRALMLDNQFPRGEFDAGSYAALQEIRMLQALGFKVTFAPRNMAYLGSHTETVQRMGVEAIYHPFEQSVEKLLENRGGEFDLVYITRYSLARELLPTVRQYAPQARVAFCNADLHFLRELRESVLLDSPELREKALITRDAEMEVVRDVDVTLSYSAAEHVVMESHAPGARIALAPWVVDTAETVPDYKGRDGIAFLGGFGHPPNRMAVEFFAKDVMPLILAQLPDVTFDIYGSGSGAAADLAALPGVRVKGYVDDVRDAYDGCRVFVAPLLTGAGVKGKVVDALAYGVPCVLSPVAAEGIAIRSGEEAVIARTAQQWADAVVGLYTDAKAWKSMSAAALSFARTRYNFEAGVDGMREALEAGGVYARPERGALVSRKARLVGAGS